MFRRWPLWILTILAVVAVAATAPARAARDNLVIGITQFPATFNPIIGSMVAKYYVLAMTRRPLTVYDQRWVLVCMLCTDMPTIENGQARFETLDDGSTGMAVDFTLQPQASWGDGTPVTTRDIMFAWKVGRHPKTGVANLEFYKRIREIVPHDDKRFTVHLDQVYHDYAARASIEPLPAHLERAAFADAREYRQRTRYDTDTTNPGLYYGPYRITEAESGSHVVLEPNATWWGDPPHFKRIVVRIIKNTSALEANLLSGAIDYVAGELGFNIAQALSFERRHPDRFKVLYKDGLTYEHIDLNLDKPILQDRRVRRALIYALDRGQLVTALFEGKQPVAHSFVSRLNSMHTGDITTYAYDPEKARALLDEAGWSLMHDDVRHNADGEPLRLRIMTTAED